MEGRTSRTAFVSGPSSIHDWPEPRSLLDAVEAGALAVGIRTVHMRQFAARSQPPAERCREEVRECDIYIGVIGFQYGSEVADEGVGYTELEMREAEAAGIPRYLFLLSENAPVPPRLVDVDRTRIDKFRAWITDKSSVTVNYFHSADELDRRVTQALVADRHQGTSGPTRIGRGAPSSGAIVRSLWGSRAAQVAVAAMILLIIIVASVSSCQGRFPEESGTRPVGAAESAVLRAASDTLRSCSREVVTEPPTCPQSVPNTASATGTGEVRWLVHGDPVSGARLVWDADRFLVRGNAVMSATYRDYSGERAAVDQFGYDVVVRWVNGGPVAELPQRLSGPDKSIVKSLAGLDRRAVDGALQAAFVECFRGKSSQVPPRCPQSRPTSAKEGTWVLDGAPTVNTRQTTDFSLGTTTVVGGYSTTFSSRDVLFGGELREVYGGEYTAIVTNEGGRPSVVMIYTSS